MFNDLDTDGAKSQDGPGLDLSPCKLAVAGAGRPASLPPQAHTRASKAAHDKHARQARESAVGAPEDNAPQEKFLSARGQVLRAT